MSVSKRQETLETFLGGVLFQDFEQHFEVVYANNEALRRNAYAIRYQTQSNSQSNRSRLMIDGYDCHSHHILMKHKKSGEFVGTIRLIVASNSRELLPVQDQKVKSAWALPQSPSDLLYTEYSEISDIAILNQFQRRESDSEFSTPLPIGNDSGAPAKQARDFPKITMGLYLAAVALARQLFHRRVYSIIPPMLFKKLRGYGLLFEQASHVLPGDVAKAVYYLNIEQNVQITRTLKGLNDCISTQLANQLHLFPGVDEDVINQ